jgi:hypothetical protein
VVQASEIAGLLARATTVVPSPEPEARYRARDGSGQVQVEIDGAARYVSVLLEGEWRRSIGGHRLGAAILAAFTAAATARLAAWAEQAADRRHIDDAPAPAVADRPGQRPHATPEVFQLLSRAWRDLHEYKLRLTELHAAATATASPGRNVVVTVRAGQIVGIELDPDWLRTARDADIERETGQTLNAALDDLAQLPEQALESCPDLRALLAAYPAVSPLAPGRPRLQSQPETNW